MGTGNGPRGRGERAHSLTGATDAGRTQLGVQPETYVVQPRDRELGREKCPQLLARSNLSSLSALAREFPITSVTRLTIRLSANAAGGTSLLLFSFRLDRLDSLDRRSKIRDFLRPPSQSEPGRAGPLGGLCAMQRLRGGNDPPRPRATPGLPAPPRPWHLITRLNLKS